MYFTFTGDLRAHVVFSYVYDYTRTSLVRNVGHFVPNRFTKQSSYRAKVLSFQSIFTPFSRVRRRWYNSSTARYHRKMIFRVCPAVSLIVSISFQDVSIRNRYISPNNRLILSLFSLSRRVSIFFLQLILFIIINAFRPSRCDHLCPSTAVFSIGWSIR